MEELYRSHLSQRNKPKNLKESDLKLFEHEFKKQIRETHVVVVKDAWILFDSIFTFSGLKFFTEYTHVTGLSKENRFWRTLMLRKQKTVIESGLWIIDDWSAGYFHWLTDALPRWTTVNNYNYPLVLSSHFKEFPYVTESLDFLGLKAVYFDRTKPVKVKKLVLPSHTAPTGNYNKEILNKLREIFFKKLTLPLPNRKIFISRQKALKRHITNENAVQKVVKAAGFEIHFFEDYNFVTQVKLMAETKCLLSLHGAGLTNMLFMQAGSSIFELRSAGDSHNNCYFTMASDLGLDYYYQLCKSNEVDAHKAEMEVDVEMLRENLKLISIN